MDPLAVFQHIIYWNIKQKDIICFYLTFSCTLGVFLSEHILNLFTFFELMTVTSYFLVIHDEDEFTHRAGNMYIAMSIAGGLIQLMGIFLLFSYVPTLFLSDIPSALANVRNIKYLIARFIIIGFGVKACMFPFHIWLPKYISHPITRDRSFFRCSYKNSLSVTYYIQLMITTYCSLIISLPAW